MLRILFCGLKYENGIPELGLSAIEHNTFYATLKQMPEVEAEMFAVDEVLAQVGREEMNQQLVARVEEFKPDLLFCVLFTEEIKKETIRYITDKTKTKTFNWFADDHWRLPVFSRYWAPLFTLVGTTDSQAPAKYRALGINNVIKTQWAANPSPYQSKYNNKNYGVTFVGKKYGNREEYIKLLQSNHLLAQGFGKGWSSGIVESSRVLEIFSCSKINLNFTESYLNWRKEIARLFIKKELGHYRFNVHRLIDNLHSLAGKRRRQIKARIFEVSACGGFLLTGYADNLRDYYEEGREITIFKDKNDLMEKCRYYLEHEDERAAIAKAGHERTLREHTYVHRFKEIFKALELKD
jgi:spore maturation protein CgeB